MKKKETKKKNEKEQQDSDSLINTTSKKILAKTCVFWHHILEHTRGLMFSKQRPTVAYIFVFNPAMYCPIHMFFVFYPITAIWLDSNMCVQHVERAKPFQPFIAPTNKQKSSYLIEIADDVHVQKGDVLQFPQTQCPKKNKKKY